MKVNPQVAISGMNKGTWIRLSGEVEEDTRREARVAMMEANPSQGLYDRQDGQFFPVDEIEATHVGRGYGEYDHAESYGGQFAKREENSVRKIPSLLSALILIQMLICAVCPANAVSGAMTVGSDIPFEDITDFYYTYDASTAPPHYQRYRLYVEDGKHYFYHETREGGGWPQTEKDITCSGTVELTEEQWAACCDLLNGGAACRREEHLDSGDAGPWLYIYWRGGEAEGREFAFEQAGIVLAFEEFCARLKEETNMRISVSDGAYTIVYELNDSPSAKSLYGMLPLDIEVENYGHNEKIFYPPQAVDTAEGIEDGGEAGGLALFSPWGNVVMFYDSFGSYPGLYILGQAVEGVEQISSLSGTIHVEAVK